MIKVFTRNDLLFECVNFIKYKREDIEKFNFTEETIEYLINIGLPKYGHWIIGTMYKFHEASEFKIIERNKEKYIIIGSIMVHYRVVIKESTQGVYCLHIDDLDREIEYCNTSLEKWTLCKMTYTKKINKPETTNASDLESTKQFGREFRAALESIDKEAMLNDKDHWRQATEFYEMGGYFLGC